MSRESSLCCIFISEVLPNIQYWVDNPRKFTLCSNLALNILVLVPSSKVDTAWAFIFSQMSPAFIMSWLVVPANVCINNIILGLGILRFVDKTFILVPLNDSSLLKPPNYDLRSETN